MAVAYFTCPLVQDSRGRWVPSFMLAAGVTYSSIFVVSPAPKADGSPKTANCLVAVETTNAASIASKPGVTQLFPTETQLNKLAREDMENGGFNAAAFLAWTGSVG